MVMDKPPGLTKSSPLSWHIFVSHNTQAKGQVRLQLCFVPNVNRSESGSKEPSFVDAEQAGGTGISEISSKPFSVGRLWSIHLQRDQWPDSVICYMLCGPSMDSNSLLIVHYTHVWDLMPIKSTSFQLPMQTGRRYFPCSTGMYPQILLSLCEPMWGCLYASIQGD